MRARRPVPGTCSSVRRSAATCTPRPGDEPDGAGGRTAAEIAVAEAAPEGPAADDRNSDDARARALDGLALLLSSTEQVLDDFARAIERDAAAWVADRESGSERRG